MFVSGGRSGASVERILLSVGLDKPGERLGQVFAAGGGHEERGEVPKIRIGVTTRQSTVTSSSLVLPGSIWCTDTAGVPGPAPRTLPRGRTSTREPGKRGLDCCCCCCGDAVSFAGNGKRGKFKKMLGETVAS